MLASRTISPPCSSNCPGSVDIPSYLSRVRAGKLLEAAKILLDCNPIPAITGRVCPHFCEAICNRGEFDESVFIRGIKRFVGDYILENAARLMRPPTNNTGKSVAVVGSGPARLSAAYYLRKRGHKVTVFDKMTEPGGMLTYCVPAYRLLKEIVRGQIRALENTGVEFRLGVEVGADVALENLKKKFDCIFLGTGAWRQRSLGIEREELLTSGLGFLTNVSLGLRRPPGKRVLVIGGGNVAVDVATAALRLGAGEVTMACLERREEMPVISEDVEKAIDEGIRLMPSWGPYRVLEAAGRVLGMELVRCTSVFDNRGHFRPTFDPSIRETVEADQIILGIGQVPGLSYAEPPLRTDRGLIVVDKDTQATSIPGVFAGGNATSGTASVVEAIAAGRKAAVSIDCYLGGGTLIDAHSPVTSRPLLEFNSDYLTKTHRVKVHELSPSQRSIDAEDAAGLDLAAIDTEASRCFNCGCLAANASDMAPALIALAAKIKTTKRTIDAEGFFDVGAMKSTVVDADELVTEVEIPAPRPCSKQAFLKFRIRNAIDFPIVSVASVLIMEGIQSLTLG